jgi:hypothetical protein
MEHEHLYYFEMPHNPYVIDDVEVAHLRINLAYSSLIYKKKSKAHQI